MILQITNICILTETLTLTQTQTLSHLQSRGNEHGNHAVWSAPATATVRDPGGLRAIMSHFSEVKAPSTLTCSNAQIMTLSNPEIMNEVFPLPRFASLGCPEMLGNYIQTLKRQHCR